MFERVGLTPYFHAICDSCVEGVEKPDPRFFQIVLERAGGRPETAMHVGDLYYVDVLGARSAGIQPVLLDPHGLYRDFDAQRISSWPNWSRWSQETTRPTRRRPTRRARGKNNRLFFTS